MFASHYIYPEEVAVQLAFRQGVWHWRQPPQATTASRAHWQDNDWEFQGMVEVELHSHGFHPAFFSATDDLDERQLRIYAVIGRVAQQPLVQLPVISYQFFPSDNCSLFTVH